jgi:hypothetical protein
LHYGCDRLPNIFYIDWLQSHLPIPEHRKNGEPVDNLEDGGEKRIIWAKHDRWTDQNSISKCFSNRQFALTALSDIQRLRASIGTNSRNMNEPFDSASLRLSRDAFGGLDMDGMKRLLSPLVSY